MASRSRRACAQPISLCASRPRPCAAQFTPFSYGFVTGPGVHETTVTRPDLFRAYLTDQIRLVIENHGVPVEIGESASRIPVHFAYRRDINVEAVLSSGRKSPIDQPLRRGQMRSM